MLDFIMGFTITSVGILNVLILIGFLVACNDNGCQISIREHLSLKNKNVLNIIITYMICFPVLILVILLKFLYWMPFKGKDNNNKLKENVK